jgi:hypothetical protein
MGAIGPKAIALESLKGTGLKGPGFSPYIHALKRKGALAFSEDEYQASSGIAVEGANE